MGEVERYPNGTFCWVDLGTNDASAAKAFWRRTPREGVACPTRQARG